MLEKQHVPDMVKSLHQYVEKGQFNKDSSIWVVHFGEPPPDMKKTYGFEYGERDRFFSHFMDLSLTHKVDEMTFDTSEGYQTINFLNFYLVELEPGENTNIDGEFLELVAKGWGVEM